MPSPRETGGFRILVADDEASIRMIVSEVLSDEGYQVELADDGVAALERVKRGGIQLVISDIRMPHMSGMELLAKIKEHDPDVQVIIMTSHASIDTAIQAMRLGAYDYLTKPFEELEVISTVVARTVSKLKLELRVKSLLGQLKRRNEQIERLYNHTTLLFKTLNRDEIIQLAIEALASLAGDRTTVVHYRFDRESSALVPATLRSDLSVPEDQQPQPSAIRIAVEDLNPRQPDFGRLVARLTCDAPADQSAVFPLTVGNQVSGALAAVRTAWPLESSARRIMRQYVENVAAQLEKSQLYARIQSMATRDGLTQIHNRRHFEKFFVNELGRATRFKKQVGLILFDIDHFKHYNDTNGHPAGDDVLREVARIAHDSARSIDLVARYGGEEFVTVLVENGIEGAAERAEALRAAIERHDFPSGEKQPLGRLTISGGFATFPECGTSPEDLIDAADKALYEAKRSGRNRMLAAAAIRETAGVS